MPLKDDLVKLLRAEINKCRIPNEQSPVEKDECMLSFDTAFSPNGLYTNLQSWQSFGKDYVNMDSNKTGQKLYLYQKKYKVLKPKKSKDEQEKDEPTKLAIGILGGFSGFDSDYEIKEQYMLCALPDSSTLTLIDLTESDIPMKISECCNAIVACKGIAAHEETAKWVEEQKESKWSDKMEQIEFTNDAQRPSPNREDWKCGECGKTENLWFNLGDGYIGCGRQQYDGSGGCGAAAKHYRDTDKKYHLAVKLGTITASSADVWSYDEDDMVTNKNLSKHLEHFGIDIMKQEKYDKTMEEMEIELNKNFIFGMIIESGKKLEHVRGKGLIGLDNLGNSCYMNALLQAIFAMKEIEEKYYKNAENILKNAPNDCGNDFVTQFCKLSVALLSDKYIKQFEKNEVINTNYAESIYGKDAYINSNDQKAEKDEKEEKNEGVACVAVKPRMLKRLVGKGHQEFSTNRQQDSVEYFRHFVESMSRAERNNKFVNKEIAGLKQLFKFKIEERLQCLQSQKVRYSTAEDIVLKVIVDLSLATNQKEVDEYNKAHSAADKEKDNDGDSQMKDKNKKDDDAKNKIVPNIPLDKLFERYLGEQIVDDWYSPATGKKGQVNKCNRLATFPDYLAIQIQRYYINQAWVPQKHECVIPVPQEIDISFMRAKGLQDNEVELKEEAAKKSEKMQPDDSIVQMLMMLGLGSENACKRAALAVQNANGEVAASWLMDHSMDADINDPIKDDSGDGGGGDDGGYKADPVSVNELAMMTGMANKYVEVALMQANGDKARAADWLFSRENLENDVNAILNEQTASKNEKKNITDGSGKYDLMAIVSHLGSATTHGHYVAHIKKNDKWYFFNDSKVAISQSPPFGHGYLYIFKRKNADNK